MAKERVLTGGERQQILHAAVLSDRHDAPPHARKLRRRRVSASAMPRGARLANDTHFGLGASVGRTTGR